MQTQVGIFGLGTGQSGFGVGQQMAAFVTGLLPAGRMEVGLQPMQRNGHELGQLVEILLLGLHTVLLAHQCPDMPEEDHDHRRQQH